MISESILKNVENEFPPVFTRKEAERLTGGLIKAKTLANLDSRRLGPPGKFRMGRQVGYSREEFLSWFVKRIEFTGNTPETINRA
ncbi:hypothetical protein D0S45_17725 [Marinifilum sp. JC120]|nr:hypothetical protein D0S45_17725 [Marinifilum sp. JC120]